MTVTDRDRDLARWSKGLCTTCQPRTLGFVPTSSDILLAVWRARCRKKWGDDVPHAGLVQKLSLGVAQG